MTETTAATEPLLLGIDLGTSSVKVVVADLAGRVHGSGAAEYPIERPAPDRAEQDPERWWAATTAATRQALAALPGTGAAGRIAAVGLDGQMHGTVLVDGSLRPIGPAIIWPDRRSGEQVAALTARLGAGRVVELVGTPLATGFQAATLRWLVERDPARLAAARHVLAPKDALRLRLTGAVATDPGDASGTALLDPVTRRWSPEMVEAVGVDPALLPPIAEAAAAAGPLLPAAAEALGLAAGIPVVVGGADTPVGLLGAGLAGPDAFLLTLSSGGQLSVPATDPAIDPSGRSHTFCAALPPGSGAAGWYRMGAILSAGLALRWLRDDILGVTGPDAYERMLGWAAEAPLGAHGCLFLPYLAGERSPHMDPDARGVFLGLTASHGRAELVRAVVEGVTLACLDASRVLAELGALPDRIVLAGGGARSRLWQSIVADVFRRPVRRLETGEQAAIGACLLAGAGAGLLDPLERSRAWATLGPEVEPDPARADRYGELGALFRSAYPTLRALFDGLADFEAGPGAPSAGRGRAPGPNVT